MSQPVEAGLEFESKRDEFLEHSATMLMRDCERYLNVQIPGFATELTPKIEAENYNPALPTFAIDTNNSYSGAEFLGMANHQNPDRQVNVVYFAGPSDGLELTENGPVLKRGMLVQPDGNIAYGEFTRPMPISFVETSDGVLLDSCAANGIPTMVPADLYRHCIDKRNLSGLITDEVRLPRRLQPDDLATFDGAVVIKPSSDAQGNGVIISDTDSDLQVLREAFDFLQAAGYSPIIEERIVSTPLTDPATGKRLDWNTRSIIANGESVDLYIRADRFGTPVNKTRGAQVILKDQLAAYTKTPAEATTILAKLEAASLAVAKTHPKGLLGLDLTIDEAGDVYMYEINAGCVGGLQTIARKTSPDSDQWLQSSKTILASVSSRIESLRHPRDIRPPAQLGRLAVSQLVWQYAYDTVGLNREELAAEQSSDHFSERRHAFNDLLAKRLTMTLDFTPDATARRRLLDQKLMTEYPLELRKGLEKLILLSIEPRQYQEIVDKLAMLYPHEPEWKICRGLIAAKQFNLAGLVDAHRQVVAETGDEYASGALNAASYFQMVHGLTDEELDESTADILKTSSRLLLSSGLDFAHQYNTMAVHAGLLDKNIALHYAFTTSLAAGEYQKAREAFEALREAKHLDSIWDIVLADSDVNEALFRPYGNPAQTLEGARLYVDVAKDVQISLVTVETTLKNIAPYSKELSDTQAAELAEYIVDTLPVAGENDEQAMVTDTLKNLILGRPADLEDLNRDSELTSFAYVMFHVATGAYSKHAHFLALELMNNEELKYEMDFACTSFDILAEAEENK